MGPRNLRDVNMKIPYSPHRWRVTPAQAVAIQKRLAGSVSQTPLPGPVSLVAGIDVSYTPDGDRSIAAVVLWDMKMGAILEQRYRSQELVFPYIPGLLSFREIPVVLKALRSLENRPDILLCDGQGLAHPRGMGLACHLGVVTDMPAVGCAKSRLTGRYEEPGRMRGEKTPLWGDEGKPIGMVVRTRTDVKPVFVSVGHRVSLTDAVDLVLTCGGGYRIPEPGRLAHQAVTKARKRVMRRQS